MAEKERAQAVLEAGSEAGEYRKHMTPEEIKRVDHILSRMELHSSMYEVLMLISRGIRV